MNDLKIVNGRMTTLAFAELTGSPHNDVLKKARKLLADLEIDEGEFSSTYLDSINRKRPMISLDKDLSLILAGQDKPKIAYHVIKSFNHQQSVQEIAPSSQADSIAALQIMANDLNLPQSEKLQAYAIGMQDYPRFVQALPKYAVDAPVVDGFIESNTVDSASSAHIISHHLKSHGVKLSSTAFNKILISEGYLETRTRKPPALSAVGGWKNYKFVTEKGLEFGKNLVRPKCQVETVPHWYDHKILELFEILEISKT